MKTIFILGCIIIALLIILFLSLRCYFSEQKKNQELREEIAQKNQCISYLYKNAKEIAAVNADKNKIEQEINNAKTDEEIAAIISDIIAINNNKLRDKAKE